MHTFQHSAGDEKAVHTLQNSENDEKCFHEEDAHPSLNSQKASQEEAVGNLQSAYSQE